MRFIKTLVPLFLVGSSALAAPLGMRREMSSNNDAQIKDLILCNDFFAGAGGDAPTRRAAVHAGLACLSDGSGFSPGKNFASLPDGQIPQPISQIGGHSQGVSPSLAIPAGSDQDGVGQGSNGSPRLLFNAPGVGKDGADGGQDASGSQNDSNGSNDGGQANGRPTTNEQNQPDAQPSMNDQNRPNNQPSTGDQSRPDSQPSTDGQPSTNDQNKPSNTNQKMPTNDQNKPSSQSSTNDQSKPNNQPSSNDQNNSTNVQDNDNGQGENDQINESDNQINNHSENNMNPGNLRAGNGDSDNLRVSNIASPTPVMKVDVDMSGQDVGKSVNTGGSICGV